jgi:molecular chaperone GrpE
MSKKEKTVENEPIQEPQAEQAAEGMAQTGESASGGAGDTPDTSSHELDTLNEALAQKEAENRELIDRMQRLAAEYDNFRKRTQKEKEKAYTDACADVITRILPVVDNLERAIKASEAGEGQSLKDGINLVLRQLDEILGKLGVKPIKAVGETFDPNLHNAVMHIEDEAYGTSEIVEEFEKGYIYKDETVIRYSMVKVAN